MSDKINRFTTDSLEISAFDRGSGHPIHVQSGDMWVACDGVTVNVHSHSVGLDMSQDGAFLGTVRDVGPVNVGELIEFLEAADGVSVDVNEF